MRSRYKILVSPPSVPGWKTFLIFLGILSCYLVVFQTLMVLLNAWMGLRHGPYDLLIACLLPNASWLVVRACLGKFRRGCEDANQQFGMARGIDFGAIIGGLMAGIYLTGLGLGLPPVVVFLIYIPLGSFIGGRMGLALRQWLLSKPKASPLVADGVSVWDRELDG